MVVTVTSVVAGLAVVFDDFVVEWLELLCDTVWQLSVTIILVLLLGALVVVSVRVLMLSYTVTIVVRV